MVSVYDIDTYDQHHAERALREFCVSKMLEKHPGFPLEGAQGQGSENVNYMGWVELERLERNAMNGHGGNQAVTIAAERVNEINRDIATFNETGEMPGWARAMQDYDPQNADGNWICPERIDPSANPQRNTEYVRERWNEVFLNRDDMSPQEFVDGMMSRHYDPALSGKTQLYQGISYQDDAMMNFREGIMERYPNSLGEGLEGNAQTAYGKMVRNTLMYSSIVMHAETAASGVHTLERLSADLTRGVQRIERMGEALQESVRQLGERESAQDHGPLEFDANPRESWVQIMEMTEGLRNPEALIEQGDTMMREAQALKEALELRIDPEDHNHPALIMARMAHDELYNAGEALSGVQREDENQETYREKRERTGESSLEHVLKTNPGLSEDEREVLEWYWREDFVEQPGDPFRERDLAGDARKLQAELEEAGLSGAGATGYATKAVLIDNAVKRMQQATFLMEAARIASEEQG